MVQSPYDFWEKQRKYDPSGASCNTIFNWFIVFVTQPEAARAILNNNGADSFKMVLHPAGQMILGDNNIGELENY